MSMSCSMLARYPEGFASDQSRGGAGVPSWAVIASDSSIQAALEPVKRVAPIDFEAASPRNESQPEMRSNHAGTQNESTLRNLLHTDDCFYAADRWSPQFPQWVGRLSPVGVGKPGDGPGPDDLTCFCVILSDASLPPKDRPCRSRQTRRGHSHSPRLSHHDHHCFGCTRHWRPRRRLRR